MTKICVLFIVLLAVTTQCANEERSLAITTCDQKDCTSLIFNFLSYVYNKSEKEERLFKAIDSKKENEFQRLITKYPLLVNAYGGKPKHTPLLSVLQNALLPQKFDVNSIAFFVGQGAHVEAMDEYGAWTPLTFVAAHSYYVNALEVANLLIQKGAKVNNRTEDKNFSPLLMAVYHPDDDTEMVELFLRHGADTTHTDIKGKTPAVRAREYGRNAIADFIENYQKVGSGTKRAK